MTNHRHRGLHLTGRDIEFFRLLFEYKIATTRQALRFSYPTATITRVRDRLARLAKLGFVKSKGHKLDGQLLNVHHLTKKGLGFVKDRYDTGAGNFKLKSDSPDHDLRLLEIGKRLEGSRHCENYITENVLQSNGGLAEDGETSAFVSGHSDAYLAAKYKGESFNVAVEYEHTPKKPSRYEAVVDGYYFTEKVDAVFYFYRAESTKRNIVAAEEKNWGDEEPKFYFCRLDGLKNAQKKVFLKDRQGTRIGI